MRTDRRVRLLNAKIKSLPALKIIIKKLKSRGKRIVFTNGCFDILHYGHIKYLEDARKMGDCLVVALNSDASVRKIKGRKRPIVAQHDRLRIIAGLESVDYVCLFNQENPLGLIKELLPDILVKGADWDHSNIIGAAEVTSHGGRVKTIHFIPGRSTTNLIKKIVKTFSG